MIDLTKTYRTTDGRPVRNLQESTRPKQAEINGKVVYTGGRERVITGEVKSPTGRWISTTWNFQGIELDCDILDNNLVLYHAPKLKQPTLF